MVLLLTVRNLIRINKKEKESKLLADPKLNEEYHKKTLENLKTEKKALEDLLTIEKGKTA